MDIQKPSASQRLPDIPITEPSPRKRDNIYYFDNIVFEVEDTLFCVPKNGFQVAGSFFETIFSLPLPEGKMVEGSDDTCPIVLRGISQANFRSFLRVLYPLGKGTSTTYEEWVGVLDLATMWDFKEIRKASILALSGFMTSSLRDVLGKILLAKKYRVKHWLYEGYSELILQTNPVEIDELHSLNLDWQTIARICSIQVTIAQYSGSSSSPFRQSQMDLDSKYGLVDAEITKVFAYEMKEMEDYF